MKSSKILLIDNFDSFTNILADYFRQLGVDLVVKRPPFELDFISHHQFVAVVFSPGPGNPEQLFFMNGIIEKYLGKLPMLGVCLGHQALGLYFGAKISKSIKPMHGKISTIYTREDKIFKGLPAHFDVVRYHSLVITELPNQLCVLAHTDDGEVMAFKHLLEPVYGVQFHPEAYLTEYGMEILKNWLSIYSFL
jgi:anthranilate synthase component 2